MEATPGNCNHDKIRLMKRIGLMLVASLLLVALGLGWGRLRAESGDDMAARLEQLQASYPVKLTDQEKADVARRCVAAQTNIQAIADRLATIQASRDLIYADILNELKLTQRRLIAQQIDTSEIDLLLASYTTGRSGYLSSLSDYHTALTDAATLDCVNNPELFRSAVEGLRASRKRVVDQVNMLRELISSDVKTSFDTIRDRVLSSEKQ